MTDPKPLLEEIDALLEHYLQLLDQYTTLRTQLSTVQSSIQQNIARANFTADRGIRYGQDLYDERMQATRKCHITGDDIEIRKEEDEIEAPPKDLETEINSAEGTSKESETPDEGKKTKRSRDPLRMFGILTPQALRVAQSDSIFLVESLLPKLAAMNIEMEKTEIEIRRKRKHKLKAEAAVESQKTGNNLVEVAT